MRRLRPAFSGFFRFLHRNQNLLLVLVAFGSMLGLALASGYWLFFKASYLIGGLVPLCFVWARLHLRGLDVSIRRSADQLQVGQRAESLILVRNNSAITKLWLEVEDLTDMPDSANRTVVTIRGHGSRYWRSALRCNRRGVFTAGPVKVTTGDPFGLFRFSRSFGAKQSMLVLPRPVELPYFCAPPAQLPGEGAVHRRSQYVTPNAAGIREYHPGDSFNRIHWPSTAKLNRLMVKTFELDPSSNLWVLLDLNAAVQAGSGENSTEEYGVSIATAIANHFLQSSRMLGLLTFDQRPVVLEPARGPQQYMRVLESLAIARADGVLSLAEALQLEDRRFRSHSTLIVITPDVGAQWVRTIQSMAQQGTRAAVVLMDPASFGGRHNSLVPFSELVGANILTYLVREGDDLSLALGPAGAEGENAPEWHRAGVK